MKRKKPQYEFPVAGESWTRGSGAPAGVFFLAGACHVVAHDSPGERELLERGALLAATVRFDGDSVETSFADRIVRPLSPGQPPARLAVPDRN